MKDIQGRFPARAIAGIAVRNPDKGKSRRPYFLQDMLRCPGYHLVLVGY